MQNIIDKHPKKKSFLPRSDFALFFFGCLSIIFCIQTARKFSPPCYPRCFTLQIRPGTSIPGPEGFFPNLGNSLRQNHSAARRIFFWVFVDNILHSNSKEVQSPLLSAVFYPSNQTWNLYSWSLVPRAFSRTLGIL